MNARTSVVVVLAVGMVLPVGAGVLAAPLAAAGGSGLEVVEGLIVGVTVLLAELLGLRLLGRSVTRKRAADRLAARNARIRAAGAYTEVAPL